jgi:mono/diheme cytochrome c family protein
MRTAVNFYFSILGATILLIAGCTGGDGRPNLHGTTNVEPIQDMMDQLALKNQDYDPFTGEAASRLPPEGTVPQGYTPYKYKGNPQAAAANLKNPLAGSQDPEILKLGQKKFETYCMVCHGPKGHGDGPVSVKMSFKPPALVSDKVKGLPDGGIFHIITDGQGVMSSYAYQLVDERDRWAIVNYIRTLQKMQ